MRQRLIDRGMIDAQFRLTPAGNDYAAAIIKHRGRRRPKTNTKASVVHEYRPQTAEHRAKLSAAQRQRLGLPEGHRRVYGVHVPETVAEKLRPLATEVAAKKGYDAAHDFVAEAEANGWRHDASKVPVKSGNTWTDERRKKASEGAAAAHARRRERAAEGERRRAAQQVEETVTVQTKVEAPAAPRDDGIRQIHGVVGLEDSKKKRLTVVEDDSWIGIEIGYGTIWLKATQARYLAGHLHDLALRLERRGSR